MPTMGQMSSELVPAVMRLRCALAATWHRISQGCRMPNRCCYLDSDPSTLAVHNMAYPLQGMAPMRNGQWI